MLRVIGNLAIILSLIICACSVVLWIRSYSISDRVIWNAGTNTLWEMEEWGSCGFFIDSSRRMTGCR